MTPANGPPHITGNEGPAPSRGTFSLVIGWPARKKRPLLSGNQCLAFNLDISFLLYTTLSDPSPLFRFSSGLKDWSKLRFQLFSLLFTVESLSLAKLAKTYVDFLGLMEVTVAIFLVGKLWTSTRTSSTKWKSLFWESVDAITHFIHSCPCFH